MGAVYSVTKACGVCGGQVTSANPKTMYCGDRCKQKAYHRRWPERVRARSARFRAEQPDYARTKWLERYDLTVTQYETMLTQQQGVCAICRHEETARHRSGTVRSLAVDHDHETGEVRGLLCRECNRGLGAFDDNAALLESAARYLRKES
jgi:hypothetical protein